MKLRFVPDTEATRAELANLYHLARSVVGIERTARMWQAAKWYAADHANVTVMGTYKDIQSVLEWEIADGT
jgi:hypothetical protein